MEKITLPRRAQVQLPQRYRGDAEDNIPADAEIFNTASCILNIWIFFKTH